MKQYYVYILKCCDGYLYTGVTNDISRRIEEHQKGLNKDCFTYKRRPVELIFQQEFNDIEQAIYFEKKIKKWSREKKLALANEDFDQLQVLSECKNKSHSKNIGLDSARPDTTGIPNVFQSDIQTENQEVFLKELEDKNIQLCIKREDQIHPFVSGNKFRKLKYNLAEAKAQQKHTLLTFGGAFSNHILATAIAGKMEGFKTIGVIRGDELGENIQQTLEQNYTLRKASENGMQFEFVTRGQYREKNNIEFIKALKERHQDFYLIPEGGTNELAIKGCEEILTEEDKQFDYICCCAGTGGTISGLIKSANEEQTVLGFPALKGAFLNDEIKEFVREKENWELITDYHFGGYGKFSEELIHFINQFKDKTGIPLDPVYTGKMLYGILDKIQQGQIPKNSKILAIHTGGLQGIEGFNERLRKKGSDLKIHI